MTERRAIYLDASGNFAEAADGETLSGYSPSDFPIFGGVILRDWSESFGLTLYCAETLESNLALNLRVSGDSRTLTLTGNPTLADWFDQGVKATSSPTFMGLTLSGLTAGRIPYVSTAGLLTDTANLLYTAASNKFELYGEGGFTASELINYNSVGASTYPFYSMRRARGTKDAPEQTSANDIVGAFNFYAHNGTAWKEVAAVSATITEWNGTEAIGKITLKASDGITTQSRLDATSEYVAVLTTDYAGTLDSLRIHYKNAIGSGGNIAWYSGGTTKTAGIQHQLYTETSTRGDLAFQVYDGTKSAENRLVEAMRIKSHGTVGIGTTGPDAKLDVLSTTEQLRLTYTDGSVFSSFTVDSSGNLTIAPTGGLVTMDKKISSDYGDNLPTGSHQLYLRSRTPSIRLQALRPRVGDVGAAFNAFEFYAENDTTSVEWVRIGAFGTMNHGGTPTYNYLFFGASYTDNALRLYSDKKAYFEGTVGIGTTGPDAKLDILSTTEQLRLTYTDGSVFSSFTVNSGGDLTIAPSGGDTIFSSTIKATGYLSSDGSAGLTQDVTVRNAAGDGTTTLTFKNGLLTAAA